MNYRLNEIAYYYILLTIRCLPRAPIKKIVSILKCADFIICKLLFNVCGSRRLNKTSYGVILI